jgi:two-component system OmpR family sensor kinase
MSKLARRWEAISLRTKITGVTALMLAFGLGVAGVGTALVLRGYLLDQVDSRLETVRSSFAIMPVVDLDGIGTYVANAATPLSTFYIALFDDSGNFVSDNLGANTAIRPEWPSPDRIVPASPTFVNLRSVNGTTEWRLLITPVAIEDSDERAILAIGSNLAVPEATVARLVAVFLFFAITVIILGGALTRLIATTTFLPLRRLESQAARFADGDYSQRLTAAPPNTEVGRLTRSLNAMLTRVDAALADRNLTIDQMRRFIGDASHELRTPLVTVRGYAELYRIGALQDPDDIAQAMERIEKEAMRMTGLVADLLELARLDARAAESAASGAAETFVPIDIVPLADDAARDAMAASPERTVTVIGLDAETMRDPARPQPAPVAAAPVVPVPTVAARAGRAVANVTGPIALVSRLLPRRGPREVLTAPVALPELPAPPPDLDAIVPGAEDKIRQVMANLLVNAERYSPPGSPIEVGVGVDAASRRAVFAVIDHGEGVPPQIREKIFQRFWRADTSRARETGGNGLGLAIVAAIVHAHHGTADVIDTPGGGATFRVFLPLA